MKHITILLYIFTIATLAIATVVERMKGTPFVMQEIYHTAWFFVLWLLTGASATYMLVKKQIWRKLPTALLHLSFIVILCGAATTFFTGVKGYMHITTGNETTHFTDAETDMERTLPFAVRLDSFVVKYYNGTDVPSDYVSHITIDGQQRTISMNKIFTKDNYRLYQSSYDDDHKGSWLSVSHDPWGNRITYSGYLLLVVASCMILCSRREGFRRLLKHPALRRGVTMTLLLLLCCHATKAESISSISRETADSLARFQVLYKGRITPFDTQAREFLKKLSGRESYKGLSAVQVVTSWQIAPMEWAKQPVIKIKDKSLRERLGASSEYLSLMELYDEKREYRLQQILADAKKGEGHDKLMKAIFETDEKVGMIMMLRGGKLITELPTDGSVTPLNNVAVETEILYNKIPVTKILFMANLTLGFVAFFLLLASVARGRSNKFTERSRKTLSMALYISTAILAINYAMRWYIGDRVPLSNGYETMIFMALAILTISCFMIRRFPFILPGGLLLSGFTLLVAHLGEMNPQITPLMPVLTSPLLSIHVSLIMISYALFAFIMLNGIVALSIMRKGDNEAAERVETITILSRLLLYPAVLFLGIGIFIGAVWANVSWGRYWAWDPKEVWALITFMIYGAAFHAGSVKRLRDPQFFHIYMIAAFAAVLITYFGVNYLLGGMHSYANS